MSEEVTTPPERTARAFKAGALVEKLKGKNRAILARLKQAEDQLAELGKAPKADDLRTENERLKSELTTAKHRDAFGKVVADKAIGLHSSVTVDALSKILGYKAEGDPEEAKIRAAIEGLKASDPYLFGTPGETKPEKPAGGGQGDRGGSGGGAAITRSQIKDPKWILVPENAKAAALAIKEGRVVD